MRTIELHAQDWSTALDFYDALLTAIGAPAWHGKNVNALVDSMIWGGINSVEPPYEVRVHEVRGSTSDIRREVKWAEQDIEEARAEFFQQHGRDPGVSFRIIF